MPRAVRERRMTSDSGAASRVAGNCLLGNNSSSGRSKLVSDSRQIQECKSLTRNLLLVDI